MEARPDCFRNIAATQPLFASSSVESEINWSPRLQNPTQSRASGRRDHGQPAGKETGGSINGRMPRYEVTVESRFSTDRSPTGPLFHATPARRGQAERNSNVTGKRFEYFYPLDRLDLSRRFSFFLYRTREMTEHFPVT